MNYTPISFFDIQLINKTDELIHHASQFLAMIGKNFLDDEPDDSNTNLSFDSYQTCIKARTIIFDEQRIEAKINLPLWQLELYEDNEKMASLPFLNQTKDSIFDFLQMEITKLGLEGNKLKFIDHYEIPQNELDDGKKFPALDPASLVIWMHTRANAILILKKINRLMRLKSEVRIWPHHFDTGTYYPLSKQKSVGAGWAAADELCDTPYFYITGWDSTNAIDYQSIPNLSTGRWIIKEGWKGAVLELKEIITIDEQYKNINQFTNHIIKFFKQQLNNNL